MRQNIEQLRKIVEDSRNIVFFGGAGVSTESSIPDFRSETGLYQAQRQYRRSPEELLSHHFYEQHTDIFFDYYKHNLIYRDAQPNAAHRTLARWEQEGKLSAVVTQNIDGLHQLAGSKRVYELHGSVLRNYCTGCNRFYDLDYIMEPGHCQQVHGQQTEIPLCVECGQVVKPDVVLYEEALQDAVVAGAVAAIMEADTLIIGGTSLVVYPAAGLIQYFKGKQLVLINQEETQYDQQADLVIHDAIGQVLGSL